MLAVYLNSKYGQLQIARHTRGAVQKGLILADMDQLVVPNFGDDFKKAIRLLVNTAFDHASAANDAIKKAQDILSNNMIVGSIESNNNPVSVKKLSESFYKTGRLDADYYQPKYDEYYRLVCSYPKGYSLVKDAFIQVYDKCDRTNSCYPYVEIGDVNLNCGNAFFNYIDTEQLPDNAKIMTKKGDIVVSTVRPNRGAVAILDTDGLLVSGAFTVLRQKSNYKKETLQVLLRTDMYRDWLLRYNVGTSYPVIKDEDVLNMPIPLFDQAIQDRVESNVQESFALRSKSKELLEFAKQAVEMAIEQGEAVAMDWLKAKGDR